MGSSGNLGVGALAGYAASRIMDQATTRFYASQSEESKRREEELAPGGTLVQLGKQLAAAVGRDLTDEEARPGRTARSPNDGCELRDDRFGAEQTGDPTSRCWTPGRALAFVVIDEGTAITTMTDYPMESHTRGVVGHGALGLAVGILLSLVEKTGGRS